MKYLLIVLLAFVAVSAEQQCTPRSYFKIECNSCVCSDDGTVSICTQRACPPGLYNKDGSLKLPLDVIQQIIPDVSEVEVIKADLVEEAHVSYIQVCTPNSHFKIDCNDCRCSDLGNYYSCAKKVCH